MIHLNDRLSSRWHFIWSCLRFVPILKLLSAERAYAYDDLDTLVGLRLWRVGRHFSGFKVGNGTAPTCRTLLQLRLYLWRDCRYPISPTIVHRTPYTQHGKRSNPVLEDENIWKLFRGGYTALLFTAGYRLLRARVLVFLCSLEHIPSNDVRTCALYSKCSIFSACLGRGQWNIIPWSKKKVRGAIARELVDSPNRITSTCASKHHAHQAAPPAPDRENKMISVVKSTTLRQAHVKARSSSATSAAAATAAAATAVVKNSSASNSNNNNNKSNHFQNTGDDAAFGSLNHLADSNEKASLDGRRIMQKCRNSPVSDLGAGHYVDDFIFPAVARIGTRE